MCSHPRTGDATDEKIAEKNREKFNELNVLRQNHGLRQRVATQAIFTTCWQRDNFKKIASPLQAKNRSCSRGFRATGHCLACLLISDTVTSTCDLWNVACKRNLPLSRRELAFTGM